MGSGRRHRPGRLRPGRRKECAQWGACPGQNKSASRLRECLAALGLAIREDRGARRGAAGKREGGQRAPRAKRFITSTFTKDHSIHYYLGPLQLNYGGLMGSGVLCRV